MGGEGLAIDRLCFTRRLHQGDVGDDRDNAGVPSTNLARMKITRRTLGGIAALLIACASAYAAYRHYVWRAHENALTARSQAAEERLIRSLPNLWDSVPLTTLLPATAMQDGPPALICTLTPYEEASGIPQLAGKDFGLDQAWLEMIEETWVGVVVLDAKGNVTDVLRLSRGKIDLLPYAMIGRCYRPAGATLVKVGVAVTGGLELTIKENATAP